MTTYRFLLWVALLANPFTGLAQEEVTWKITLNKKVILTGIPSTDTPAYRIPLKKEELANNNLFKIDYLDKNARKGKDSWIRTMMVADSADNVLITKDSISQLMIYNKDLLKLIWARKKLIVYTWSAPPDPAMAAVIRIRRQRLCTLELVD